MVEKIKAFILGNGIARRVKTKENTFLEQVN